MKTFQSAIFAFFFGTALLTAQGFDITYPISIPSIGADIEQTIDGGYVVPCGGDTLFLKLDAQGQIDWFYNPILQNGNGFYAPGGSAITTYSDGTMTLGGTKKFNGFLAHVDDSGQLLEERLMNRPVLSMSGNDLSISMALLRPDLFESELWGYNFYTSQLYSEGDFQAAVVEVAADNIHYFVGGEPIQDLSVRKYELSSQLQTLIWEYSVPSVSYSGIWAIEEANDGSVYAVGSRYNNGITPFLVKLDANGTVVFEKYFPGEGSLHSIREMANGNLVIGGAVGGAVILQISPQGDLVWERRFSTTNSFHCRVIPTSDNGFAMYTNGDHNQVRVIKMDAEGDVYNFFLEGTAYYDVDDNCSASVQDSTINNKTIIATEVNTGAVYTTTSDAQGNYAIDVAPGTYEISVSLVNNWQPCQTTTITLAGGATTAQIPDIIYKYNDQPFSTFEGNMFIDVNNNCIFDPGVDDPLECISIPLVREEDLGSGVYWYAETDENGFYSVDVPANNHYYLYNTSEIDIWQASANFSGNCLFNFVGISIGAYKTQTIDFPLANAFTEPAYIDGHVYIDENSNCIRDAFEVTANFPVRLIDTLSGDTISTEILQDGYFGRILEAGVYQVFVDLGGNDNWQVCDSSLVVNVDGTCVDKVDLAIQPATQCADLSVSVATNSLILCEDNTLFVSYENVGAVESSPTIQVVLDSLMTYNSSSIAPTTINGDTLIFDISDVAPLTYGSFSINVFLSCDAVFGETHCVEATISSDNDCPTFSQNWDGSSVQITGSCTGGELEIKIENVGLNPMSEMLEYIVIEDNILGYSDGFQLGAGDFITLNLDPAGKSIFIEAEQSANHPTISMPAKSYEGCGVNQQGTFSLGYITQYRQDDAANDISIFCLENAGPYDPNDKQGFPRGISDQHFIEASTQLEYMIRFQNVGTAPAQNVVITDVLSEFLDSNSVRAGVSSHAFEMERIGDILTFTFEDIFLPDSLSNPEGSQGFITFIVDQINGNPSGTEILNKASIVFDSNLAILTNETSHKIPFPVENIETDLDLCEGTIWNDEVISSDTSIVQLAAYLFYNQVETITIQVQDHYQIQIDTLVPYGSEFFGQVVNSETVYVDLLSTEYGCDSIVVYNIDVLSSLSDLPNSDISIVPNPTNGLVTIVGAEQFSNKIFDLRVYNQTGREVGGRKNIEGDQLDLSYLPAGVYFIKIQWSNQLEILKLLKL